MKMKVKNAGTISLKKIFRLLGSKDKRKRESLQTKEREEHTELKKETKKYEKIENETLIRMVSDAMQVKVRERENFSQSTICVPSSVA